MSQFALGSLVAGAAHELSTPLATMAVVTGELQREHGDNPVWADSLQILRQQLAACKAILAQLTAEGGRLLAVDVYRDALVARWQLLRPGVLLHTQWEGGASGTAAIGRYHARSSAAEFIQQCGGQWFGQC